jgi:excisionase family DNA binding protein
MQSNEDQWTRVMQANDTTKPDAKCFYTVSAVASMVGVSSDSIRRAIASEVLPAYKIGRSVRISYGDVEEWLEANRYRASESVTQNVTVPATVDFRW